MKDSLRGRKLDHEYCISRMDIFEKKAYDFIYKDTEFRCGTGFSDAQRKEIWENKESYLGKLASIRYMSVGSKDLPRCPSFVWFRDKDDI